MQLDNMSKKILIAVIMAHVIRKPKIIDPSNHRPLTWSKSTIVTLELGVKHVQS